MNSKYTIGDSFPLDPDIVGYNDDYTDMNPLHKKEEYESTYISIQDKGQLKPIYLLNGKCVDGRHRTRICKDLGIKVNAINLNPDLSTETIYDLCNVDTMAGRNLTPTQRSILALDYKEKLKQTGKEVAKKFQVQPQSITYAKKLRHTYNKENVLRELKKGNAVQLSNMDTPSKSLEYLCKKAKELHEENIVSVDNKNRIQFDPDAQITSEQGKNWYYDIVNYKQISDIEIRMYIAELANYKFVNTDEGKTLK